MPSDQPQIDSAIDIKTAENIAFSYRTAGPLRRGVGFGIDFVIRAVVFIAVGIVLGVLGIFSGGAFTGIFSFIFLIMWFVTECFYGALFETFMNGQTPGKWILGVRVVTKDGQPINGMQAVLRNLFRWVDMSPPLYIPIGDDGQFFPAPVTCMVALVTMSIDPRFRRLGDLVGGTMVVVNERNWLIGMAKLDDARAMKLAAYIPADFEVSRNMGQALSAYVERRRFFSEARRREIARYLGAPLVKLFGFPGDTSHDLLLCALYYRKFVADAGQEGRDEGSMLEGTAMAKPYGQGQMVYPGQSYPAQPYQGQPYPAQPYQAAAYLPQQSYPGQAVPNPFIQAQQAPMLTPQAPPQSGGSTFLPPR